MRWFSWVACLGWVAGLYMALIYAPDEQFLGASQRIFYVHVSIAWIAAVAFIISFIFSLHYLIKRKPSSDIRAAAAAEIGTVFTTIVLVSGSLWARVAWGTFWTWDPRLTTTAIMWFLYIGYLLIRGAIDNRRRRAVVSGVFNLIAFLDVPIVFESIRWWRTIHPVVITDTGFNMPPSMVISLMVFLIAATLFFIVLFSLKSREMGLAERLQTLRERRRVKLLG